MGILSRKLRYSIKPTLFNACCKPVIAYGNENCALTNTDLLKAQGVEGNSIKKMISLPEFASTTRLLDALRVLAVSELIRRLKLSLFDRLTKNRFTKSIMDESTADREVGRWQAKSLIQEVRSEVSDITYVQNRHESELDLLIAKAKLKSILNSTTLGRIARSPQPSEPLWTQQTETTRPYSICCSTLEFV